MQTSLPQPLFAEHSPIGAVILAAGGSTRLGQPKQLLVYEGKTLVRKSVDAAEGAGCSTIIVVAGDEHAEISGEISGTQAQLMHHPFWERGIGSSIRAGVEAARAAQPGLAALLLMVCDQPLVTAGTLAALLSTRASTGRRIVACAYSGTLGVPALFDSTFFDELASLPDSSGAKQLFRSAREEVVSISFPGGSMDIDTPADHLAYLCSRREIHAA